MTQASLLYLSKQVNKLNKYVNLSWLNAKKIFANVKKTEFKKS